MRLFIEGGRFARVMLAFRKLPVGELQGSYFPLDGLTRYGPFEELRMLRLIHIIPEQPLELRRRIERIKENLVRTIKNNLRSICRVEHLHLDERNVENIGPTGIEELKEQIKSAAKADEPTVILLPIFREVLGMYNARYVYYVTKGLSLSHGVSTQVYTENTESRILNIGDYYTILNLSLNIFSKAGGVPWALYDKLGANVLVGMNWSFLREEGRTGPVTKVFAFAQTFDDGGVYRNMYATVAPEDRYIDGLKTIINEAVEETKRKVGLVENVAILTAKRLKREELCILAEELNGINLYIALISDSIGIRAFNTSDRYYLIDRGTFFFLSDRKAFYAPQGVIEGVSRRIMGTPVLVKVELLHPLGATAKDNRQKLLELVRMVHAMTVMNWRTFMGLSRLPAPLHYAKLVSIFVREFTRFRAIEDAFPNIRKGLLEPHGRVRDKPWFL